MSGKVSIWRPFIHQDWNLPTTPCTEPASMSCGDSFRGRATPAIIDAVESRIPDEISLNPASLEDYTKGGLIEEVDLETLYCEHVRKSFDLEAIHSSGLELAYDAMYGAGQHVMRRLFPDITFLHAENNPGFDGQAPEPIHKNLTEL